MISRSLGAAIRAVISIGQPDSPIAKASRSLWAARLKLASPMVDLAIAREEIPPDVDPHTPSSRRSSPRFSASY